MPILSVTIIEGRDVARKRALVRALTDATVRSLGVEAEQVRVILNEVPMEHFAVGGISFAEKAEGANLRNNFK